MVDTEKSYQLKKQLRKLETFRGNGTELISVYIPAGSPIHEMNAKLREEAGQASNIKSKSTKLNVIGALERIMNYFKTFKKAPPNGIAVFAGNVSDNPAKTDIELFSVDPPEPLSIGMYRCDSKFFLEPLQSIIDVKDTYGIVVLDGREATIATVRGTHVTIIKKLNSTAHAKVNKGGQCLAAGTLIVKDNGEIIDIEKFVEGNGIIGLDFNTAKTVCTSSSDFFITQAKHSFVIKIQCPLSEIRTTAYHRFFVISEHGIKEKFAKNLSSDDRILIAKKINCIGTQVKTGFEPNKVILLDDNERKKLVKARLKMNLSQKKVAELVGLSQMIISYIEHGTQRLTNEHIREIYKFYDLRLDEKRLSKNTLKFPQYWNTDLARLCGIICGDGTIDGNRIIIYEGKEELVRNYCKLIERAIGITPTVRIVDKTKQKGSFAKKEYYEIRIYSLEFANAMVQIAPSIIAKGRDIPTDITRCENSVVAAFLSGLYDAEGYISANKVDIAMTSKKLLQKVHLLLLRFGILSSFAEKRVKGNKQWMISITDKNALNSFRENIGFTRKDKMEKLNLACQKKDAQQYVDQIPIDGREVFKLAKEIGLKTSDFHAASGFFRNEKPLGRIAFERNILSVFRKHQKTEKGKEIFKYLDAIYNSDFTVATIKEKIHVASEEQFYDITIPKHSNFVANGLIVHNSQRRFQRLVEESIELYYKRIGESMDDAFVNRVKGVIVGGPGPSKDNFIKMSPFNYQLKVLGVVDTGYTEEYGIREVLAKSENILAQQEAIKEKILVDRFIRGLVNDEGLVVYGVNEVRDAINSRQAEKVLLSEGLTHISAVYICSNCANQITKSSREKLDSTIECPKCKGQMKVEKEELMLDELAELAKQSEIAVEILSTDTTEGAQFLSGFGGVGAFLKYRTR